MIFFNMQEVNECRCHYYPLLAGQLIVPSGLLRGQWPLMLRKAGIVIHVSNTHQTNSEFSSFLPALSVACSQLWESRQGVLIRGDSSPGLWFTGTGEQSSCAREQARSESGGKKAEGS